MKIDKAIELLTRWQDGNDITSFDDVNRAIRLGIEALREVKKARYGGPALDGELLPGETEEDHTDIAFRAGRGETE